ncbi:MCE family protein [Actinocorallia sp. B10E7]|uniref:MCE family protein n=1 Tax=Actinocorallia sp. B10E7 TaxID=3153558 RepID=UPI00325D58A5
MRPRILLNLSVFAAVATVMFVWAALTLLPIRFGEEFIRIEARFASSPGLRSGLEVDYLGVPIGSVEKVRLRPGRVEVTLLVDPDLSPPGTVTARVLRKSAVGEPYVELEPPDSGATAPPLEDGDVIPLSRTDDTVEYQRLFENAGRMLRAVDPEDLKTLTHELATGLDGRGRQVHDTLADLDHLTRTVADEAGVLDALAVQLTTLAGTLADKGPRLASGMNDLAAFTAALSDSDNEIDSVLDNAPNLTEQVNALLEESRPGMRCVLTAAGTPGTPVFTPENSKALQHALKQLRYGFPAMVDDVLVPGPEGGSYVRATAVITLAGPIPNSQEYPEPLAAPEKPPLYHCRDAPVRDRSVNDADRPAREPDEAARPAGTDPEQVFRTVAPRPAAGPRAKGPTDRWLPRLPIAAAALVLLGTAVHTVRRMRSLSDPRRRP